VPREGFGAPLSHGAEKSFIDGVGEIAPPSGAVQALTVEPDLQYA
jgi:hypothetical protein